MHRILTEHPEYVALEERRADLEAARSVFSERQRTAREKHEAAMRDHRRATREAVLAGETSPEAPEPPDDQSDQAHLFLEEQGKLRAERKELLAALAVELETRAEASFSIGGISSAQLRAA